MSWEEIEFTYGSVYVFQKHLLWIDKNANVYFAMKVLEDDDWSYFAGSGSHGLVLGKMTAYDTEVDAQTNYLTTDINADGKFVAILPSNVSAKYVRLYVESGNDVELHEWWPSTYITAHEIISGEILITNLLSDSPRLKVEVDDQERLFLGELSDDIYGLRGKDSSGEVTFELSSNEDVPYVSNYADHKAIELEMMKMNFQQISWAQFAVYDAFDDETKRASGDARVYRSRLDNGEDGTASKEFDFVSVIYDNITTVDSGTSTNVGLNYLEDTGQAWFTNECTNLKLVDSGSNEFTITSNTSNTLTVAGTPDSGSYYLVDSNPQYMVGFCSLSDESNGGTGQIKFEVSLDNGGNYQVIYDTINSPNVDLRQATVEIDNPGNDYIVRITLKNDGSGDGAIVYKWLICTDPSMWRF